MSTYTVIESVPDFSESTDFNKYSDAVAYANKLADDLEYLGYRTARIASSGNYYAITANKSERVHDEGRVTTVERTRTIAVEIDA